MAPVVLDDKSASESPRSDSPVHGLSSVVKDITLGRYVFERLLNCGSKTIFGVPGDFNLPLLEYLYEEELVQNGLQWVGTCNELNAAYAADGYSRYTSKIGCVITTFGVGELSALNGISGAFAEDVKVLHIVGVSPTKFRKNDKFRSHNVHHLVPDLDDDKEPNHEVYFDMIKDRVSCSSAFLHDVESAPEKIDKVIADIYKYSKPGYIFIPADFADEMVSNKNLVETPVIDLPYVIENTTSKDATKKAGDKILQWLYESKTPSVFSDALVGRFNLNKDIRELINKVDMWNFTTAMAKSSLDEHHPKHLGVYKGAETGKEMQSIVEMSDLILHFGPCKNEINFGYYTFRYNDNARVVELSKDKITFFETKANGSVEVQEANFAAVLNYMNENLDVSKISTAYPSVSRTREHIEIGEDDEISQQSLKRIVENFYNPGDVLVVETGSFQFNLINMKFAPEMKYMTQTFYLSIGMALPAALGVGCGMRDYPRSHIINQSAVPADYVPKLILCEGDGAAQMTIQEFASYIRYKIPMNILLFNNNGYTIERAILGPTRSYNDIAPVKWTALLNAFGDFENKFSETVTVSKNKEIIEVLNEWKKEKVPSKIKLAEVMLPVMDIPSELDAMLVNGKPK